MNIFTGNMLFGIKKCYLKTFQTKLVQNFVMTVVVKKKKTTYD